MTDHFREIMHELRRQDVFTGLGSRFELIDAAKTSQGVSGRAQRAVFKTASRLLKLLHPHGQVAGGTWKRCYRSPVKCGSECARISNAARPRPVLLPDNMRVVEQGATVASKGAKSKPKVADHTFEEVKYLKHLVDNEIPVLIRLENNEEVRGTIEFYDAGFLRLTREDGPNLFIYKHDIKYLYELEHA